MNPVILSHQTENKSMSESELKKQLDLVNANLVILQNKNAWWRSLLSGIMSGFGSVIGVVLALAVIGWLLNIAGIIPAFKKETEQWKSLIQQVQQQRLPTKSQDVK